MFSLRIHSVDTNNLLTISTSTSTSSQITNPNTEIQESRGVIHLYRSIISSPNPNNNNKPQESTVLFIVAVPSHISSDDFRRFCGSYMEHILEILLIRNDGMEDRYSVLIKLVDRKRAIDFYRNFNGRRFLSSEAEVCHILFTVSVELTEFAEIASTAPPGFTELPTCPVCLERLDQDTSGILSTLCDHSFQCSCISKWTDSSCLVCQFCQQQAEKPTCSICGTSENLWICVICGFIGCGRYKERHAIQHWRNTQHCYSLDLETQRVWDYVGDTYVHRLNQSKTNGKLKGMRTLDGDCGTCESSEESGNSLAVASSKIEATCFQCGANNHFKNECPWNDFQCTKCKKAMMRVFLCKQGPHKGEAFLRCATQPMCQNFLWVSELEGPKIQATDEKKVKLTVTGKKEMKLVFEGNVEDLCDIVKRLDLK